MPSKCTSAVRDLPSSARSTSKVGKDREASRTTAIDYLEVYAWSQQEHQG